MSRACTPWRASSAAANSPEGPAPTIKTSLCITRSSWKRTARDWSLADRNSAPAPPGAHGLAHHQRLVTVREPGQLLGEHRHALPPGARHLRDVGAPEHARRAEGVVDLAQVPVHSRERVRPAAIAWCAGRLDRD